LENIKRGSPSQELGLWSITQGQPKLSKELRGHVEHLRFHSCLCSSLVAAGRWDVATLEESLYVLPPMRRIIDHADLHYTLIRQDAALRPDAESYAWSMLEGLAALVERARDEPRARFLITKAVYYLMRLLPGEERRFPRELRALLERLEPPSLERDFAELMDIASWPQGKDVVTRALASCRAMVEHYEQATSPVSDDEQEALDISFFAALRLVGTGHHPERLVLLRRLREILARENFVRGPWHTVLRVRIVEQHIYAALGDEPPSKAPELARRVTPEPVVAELRELGRHHRDLALVDKMLSWFE
jgi:hypothetical protein